MEASAPTAPRQLSLTQIEEILSRPLPKSMLRTKTIKGNKITYLSWFDANRILSKYCPGWTWEITKFEISSDRASSSIPLPKLPRRHSR